MGKGEDAGRERTRDDIPHLYKQRPASIQMTSGSDKWTLYVDVICGIDKWNWQNVSAKWSLQEFCQTDCTFFENLTLFVQKIWWGQKKAVILQRISKTRVSKPYEYKVKSHLETEIIKWQKSKRWSQKWRITQRKPQTVSLEKKFRKRVR